MKHLFSQILTRLRGPRARAGMVVMLGTSIGAAASFVAAIVAARSLAVDEFAAFGVGMAVNSLTMQFADLGMGTVAMTEAAEAVGVHQARAKLARLAVRRVATALIAGLLIAVAMISIPSLEPYREVALIAVAGGIIGCLALFTVGALQAFRRFRPAGAVQGNLGVSRLVLVAGAGLAGFGAEAMMVGYGVLAPVIATAYGAVVLFRHRRSELAKGPPGPVVDAELDLETIPVADARRSDGERRRNIAIMAVFSALLLNGDVLLLSLIGSADEVAVYSAGWRIAAGLLLLNAAFASAILPFVLASADPWSELRRLIRIGLAVAGGWLLLVVPMTFAGVRILGPAGDGTAVPLLILLVAFALDAFFFITLQVYYRIRRERFLAILVVFEFMIMVVTTVLLREHGATAPAVGQLAARVFVCVAVMVPIGLARRGRIDWFQIRPHAIHARDSSDRT